MFGKSKPKREKEKASSDTDLNKSEISPDSAFDDWDTETTPVATESIQETPVTQETTEAKIQEDKAEQEPVIKEDMVLYVIIDRDIPGLVRYMTESGLKVSGIYNSITEVKNAVLMQSEPTRIVVIDTGLGKFTTTKMREELIDMLGISDEQNKTTVFYTDSVLKIDTNKSLGKSGKSIEWIKYTTTSIVVATIMSYEETYVYDTRAEDNLTETEESVMEFKGLTTKLKEVSRHNIPGFSSEAIQTHMINSDSECLPRFKINL